VFEEVFWSVILPALCAGIVAACCLIPSGLSHKTMWRRGVIALTLMGAAAGSFIGSVGMPAWPPAQKWHGIFYVMLAMGCLGLVDAIPRRGDWASRVLIGIAAGGATWWLLPLPAQLPITVAAVVAGGALVVSLVDAQRPSLAMPVGSWAAGAAVSMLALVAGSMSLAFMAGAMSAMAGVFIVIRLFPNRVVSGGGAMLGGGLAAICVTAMAYDYGDVPVWAWLLAMGGFPLVCMLEIGSIARWQGAAAATARSVLLVSPPVASIWMNFDAIQGAFSA